LQNYILIQKTVLANDATKHASEDVKNIGSAGEGSRGENEKSEDGNYPGVASPTVANNDEATANVQISATQISNNTTITDGAGGSTTNSAPLAKFENLETALTTTLGTHGYCPTVPHVINSTQPNCRTNNVANIDTQQAGLTQVSSLDAIHMSQQPCITMPEACETTQRSTSELAAMEVPKGAT
uniref:Merozoite surface protein duffy binding ligand 2 n=1 Tax=Onchocerca flexuosa TaxID=387005 RepID=A0A183I799_9BILA